jgi:hypothetical protein
MFKHSEKITELAAAMAEAQAEFRAVGKSGENTYDRYSYANLDDYVRTVRPVLAKHGLSVMTGVSEVVALEDRTTSKGGKEHAVRVKLGVLITHKSGEWVEAEAWGEGQDRADKSVYKAITGARKYALASVFGLATSDDPEADEQVGRSEGTPARGRQQQRQQQQQARPAAERQQPLAHAAAEGDALEDLARFKSELHGAFVARSFAPEREKGGGSRGAQGVRRHPGQGTGPRPAAHADHAGKDGKADKYKFGANAAEAAVKG